MLLVYYRALGLSTGSLVARGPKVLFLNSTHAPVAQWIECWPPEPETRVRPSPGVPYNLLGGITVLNEFNRAFLPAWQRTTRQKVNHLAELADGAAVFSGRGPAAGRLVWDQEVGGSNPPAPTLGLLGIFWA